MKHQPIKMISKPYVEISIMDDLVELKCPTCGHTIIDYEKNVVFRPYNYICEGVDKQSIEIENEFEVPF